MWPVCEKSCLNNGTTTIEEDKLRCNMRVAILVFSPYPSLVPSYYEITTEDIIPSRPAIAA